MIEENFGGHLDVPAGRRTLTVGVGPGSPYAEPSSSLPCHAPAGQDEPALFVVHAAVPQPPEQLYRHVHSDALPRGFQIQRCHGAVGAERGLLAHDPHLVLGQQL